MSRGKNNTRKRRDRIHRNIAPMPPDYKKELLPYAVVKLLTGAQATPNYRMKADLVRLVWNNEDEVLHVEDYQIAKSVADQIWQEQVEAKNLLPSLNTAPVALELHLLAARYVRKIVNSKVGGKKKLIFIKDRSGCGYWRMVVPARYIDPGDYHIDMAETEVVYDYLLEYDVIVVQRLHSWREFYTIERLKRQGKRVVYDIDDDIFNIPDDNPAVRIIRRDEQAAARAIMDICDSVTTTTEVLKQKLGCPEKTVVIPNAIDFDDGYPARYLGSPDEWKRILWMGSPTHEMDWHECISAVDGILKSRDDVRLLILGYLPQIIAKLVDDPGKPYWDARVEFSDFQEIETYVATTKCLRAEVALAPLCGNSFTAGKSNLKWIEYTGVGAPVVASNVTPYKEDIEHGVNGILASTQEEWFEAIMHLLDDSDEGAQLVSGAVKTIEERFDVKRVVKDWERAILGA